MAVRTSTSRTFECDVSGCGKKEVIPTFIVSGGVAPANDDLPFGWNPAATGEIHCPDHTYKWDADKQCYFALPRRTRKARVASDG